MKEKEFCDDIHGIEPVKQNEEKFIIIVSTSADNKHLVEFGVPIEQIENCKTYDEKVNRAGWWYQNKIDHICVTGDYRWTVYPKSFLSDIYVRC